MLSKTLTFAIDTFCIGLSLILLLGVVTLFAQRDYLPAVCTVMVIALFLIRPLIRFSQ